MSQEQNTPELKQPKTFKEQVDIFKSRNLHIEDSEYTEKLLERVNYYRLSAYTLTLKDPQNNELFSNDATFEQLISLYEFDRKLRQILMGILENIEVAFRTHIAYLIAHQYGSLGHLNPYNFNSPDRHTEFTDELNRLFSLSEKGELFIKHHFDKYDGQIPVWVAIEVTSFGTISKLYQNLKEENKNEIAKGYYGVRFYYLESWLRTLSYIRNVCAHYGRLYNKNLVTRPLLFKYEKNILDNTKLFAAIYVANRLLTKLEGDRFITDLTALISEFGEYIDLANIGFPANWNDILSKSNAKKK